MSSGKHYATTQSDGTNGNKRAKLAENPTLDLDIAFAPIHEESQEEKLARLEQIVIEQAAIIQTLHTTLTTTGASVERLQIENRELIRSQRQMLWQHSEILGKIKQLETLLPPKVEEDQPDTQPLEDEMAEQPQTPPLSPTIHGKHTQTFVQRTAKFSGILPPQ